MSKFTFLSSLQIPPEQVCLQSEQSSEPVNALQGSTLLASGHNFEVKNESLLHLGSGVPSTYAKSGSEHQLHSAFLRHSEQVLCFEQGLSSVYV